MVKPANIYFRGADVESGALRDFHNLLMVSGSRPRPESSFCTSLIHFLSCLYEMADSTHGVGYSPSLRAVSNACENFIFDVGQGVLQTVAYCPISRSGPPVQLDR